MSARPEEEILALRQQRDLLELQLAAVRRLAGELSSVTRLDDTVRGALNTSLDVVGANAGSILLLDPRADKLEFRYVVGEKADELTGMQLSPDEGIAGAVFRSGEVRVSADVTRETDHLTDVGDRINYATRNMVTVPLKSHQGKALGVMQVLNKEIGAFEEHDVATLAILGSQIASAIEAAQLQEQARLAQVVKVIGDISHDVKNMITPVQTGAETIRVVAQDAFDALAQAPDDLPPELRCHVEDLRDLLPEMLDLIVDGADTVQQRMAEIAAAVKGLVSKPHFELAGITEVAEKAIALLRPQAARAGIELRVAPAGEIPQFPMDRKQMYNAFYNLAFNAMGACSSGASITFVITASDPSAPPEEAWCQVDCVDTGEGMPEAVRARLFTDDAVSTKPMGTGLGTRIIKNVVDAHGGRIWVQSEAGAGTTVSFRVPTFRELPPE